MVQRLFADVINDAIWFMNIHEQNHPWYRHLNSEAGNDEIQNIRMSLKSFSIYIVKFFELYISAVLLPIVL
jgi:hypothetical protein